MQDSTPLLLTFHSLAFVNRSGRLLSMTNIFRHFDPKHRKYFSHLLKHWILNPTFIQAHANQMESVLREFLEKLNPAEIELKLQTYICLKKISNNTSDINARLFELAAWDHPNQLTAILSSLALDLYTLKPHKYFVDLFSGFEDALSNIHKNSSKEHAIGLFRIEDTLKAIVFNLHKQKKINNLGFMFFKAQYQASTTNHEILRWIIEEVGLAEIIHLQKLPLTFEFLIYFSQYASIKNADVVAFYLLEILNQYNSRHDPTQDYKNLFSVFSAYAGKTTQMTANLVVQLLLSLMQDKTSEDLLEVLKAYAPFVDIQRTNFTINVLENKLTASNSTLTLYKQINYTQCYLRPEEQYLCNLNAYLNFIGSNQKAFLDEMSNHYIENSIYISNYEVDVQVIASLLNSLNSKNIYIFIVAFSILERNSILEHSQDFKKFVNNSVDLANGSDVFYLQILDNIAQILPECISIEKFCTLILKLVIFASSKSQENYILCQHIISKLAESHSDFFRKALFILEPQFVAFLKPSGWIEDPARSQIISVLNNFSKLAPSQKSKELLPILINTILTSTHEDLILQLSLFAECTLEDTQIKEITEHLKSCLKSFDSPRKKINAAKALQAWIPKVSTQELNLIISATKFEILLAKKLETKDLFNALIALLEKCYQVKPNKLLLLWTYGQDRERLVWMLQYLQETEKNAFAKPLINYFDTLDTEKTHFFTKIKRGCSKESKESAALQFGSALLFNLRIPFAEHRKELQQGRLGKMYKDYTDSLPSPDREISLTNANTLHSI